MKPSETIIELRKLWAKIEAENLPQKEQFETEDAFVFYHLDAIASKSKAVD